MKLDRLQELKQKLVQENDFSEIWSFYMDHFADHPEFIEVGEPVRDDFLEAVLPQICQEIFYRGIQVSDLLLIYIAEHQFFHGPFQVEGRIGGMIYFQDAKVGLLAVSADFPPTDAVKYSRFSGALKIPLSKRPIHYEYN